MAQFEQTSPKEAAKLINLMNELKDFLISKDLYVGESMLVVTNLLMWVHNQTDKDFNKLMLYVKACWENFYDEEDEDDTIDYFHDR
jgi:hypothetical protein